MSYAIWSAVWSKENDCTLQRGDGWLIPFLSGKGRNQRTYLLTLPCGGQCALALSILCCRLSVSPLRLSPRPCCRLFVEEHPMNLIMFMIKSSRDIRLKLLMMRECAIKDAQTCEWTTSGSKDSRFLCDSDVCEWLPNPNRYRFIT